MPAPKRFNKGSIRVSEGALRHLRCHPCRVFSYSYGSETPFHGGNMGSNPVGDANKIINVYAGPRRFQRLEAAGSFSHTPLLTPL